MKTIELTDEVYTKLIVLATEMTTQDMRGTRMPHIFQIRDWKKVYDWSMNGDTHIWVNDYYETEIETVEEFKFYLEDNGYKIPDNFDELWNNDYWWDMEEFIEENNIELKQCSYSLEPIYTNCFLTAKAAEEHLRLNHYHYHKNADVYLNHAWRNPEAELVSTFLCGLIGKEMYR
jgi:hypothetical protein